MPSSVGKIRKKLAKAFTGKVQVQEENGAIVLTGELERWIDVVTAGMQAAHEKNDKDTYIVNNIECTTGKPLKTRTPRVEDTGLDGEEFDVLIIGGGIIGCAAARELSRYNLRILLIEKEHDVAMQATGRSAGLVHCGVKLVRGSSKLRYTKLGNKKIEEVCTQLNVPFKRCGQYLVYANRLKIWPRLWTPFLFISSLYWRLCGMQGVQIITGEQLGSLEPGIGSNVGTALFFPSGGVVNPRSLAVAYAENSVQNGVFISFDTMAQEMSVENGIITSVTTNRGTVKPKIVLNAAGVSCEDIAEMAGDKFYSIHPVKGTSAIIDREHAGKITGTAITLHGKFLGKRNRKSETISNILRTTDGTVLVGPFYLESMSKEDFSTDSYSAEKVVEQAKRVCPSINREDVIEFFSGISATSYEGDFIVSQGKSVTNIVHAAGIQFPGLTACPAIAEDIARLIYEMFGGKSAIADNPEFNPFRMAPPVVKDLDPNERESLISGNPDYGVPVCHCEQVTRGEIVDALNSNVVCDSIDAVSRRTNACRGKCQGICCMPAVLDIIAAEKHIAHQQVHKSAFGSEVVYGSSQTFIEPPEIIKQKGGEHQFVPALVQDDEDAGHHLKKPPLVDS